jgi:hypothetical protein
MLVKCMARNRSHLDATTECVVVGFAETASNHPDHTLRRLVQRYDRCEGWFAPLPCICPVASEYTAVVSPLPPLAPGLARPLRDPLRVLIRLA